MDRLTLFADVLLPLPVAGTFTYRVPFDLNEFIKVGQRVKYSNLGAKRFMRVL